MKNRILFLLTFCGLANQSLLLFASDHKGVVARPMQTLPKPQPSSFDTLLNTYDNLSPETKNRTEKGLQVTKLSDLASELSTPAPIESAPIESENSIKILADIENDGRSMSAEAFSQLTKEIKQEQRLLEQDKKRRSDELEEKIQSREQEERIRRSLEQQQRQLEAKKEILEFLGPIDSTPKTITSANSSEDTSFFNQKTVKWGIFISTIAGLFVASFVWKDQISDHMNGIKDQIMEFWAKIFTNLPIEKADATVQDLNLETKS